VDRHATAVVGFLRAQNAIARIEGLDGLAALNTLNLSQNAIERIEPGSLACLPALATLVLSRNRLQSADDVAAVAECGSLTNLDLSHNDIDDSAVVDAVRALPALACLALTGNPFLRTARQYRKTVLAALPRLAHLDDRPVFEEERVAVTAWEVGGAKAERDARKVRPGRSAPRRSRHRTRRRQPPGTELPPPHTPLAPRRSTRRRCSAATAARWRPTEAGSSASVRTGQRPWRP